MAATILWALTGRRFGCCPVTVRPCKPEGSGTIPLPELIYWDRRGVGLDNLGVTTGWVPILEEGRVYNIACGCKGLHRCKADCEFTLPGPVCEITSVTNGGVLVDPDDYMVLDNRLVFLNDSCPTGQDYNLPAGEVGTWSVTYTIGESWPAGADLMAGLLACEYGRAVNSDPGCGLPAGVQSVVREGVDIGFLDPMALADAGLTGLPVVNDWIRAANPDRLRQRARAWSPDLPVVRRES
jgi:hypothetical protein